MPRNAQNNSFAFVLQCKTAKKAKKQQRHVSRFLWFIYRAWCAMIFSPFLCPYSFTVTRLFCLFMQSLHSRRTQHPFLFFGLTCFSSSFFCLGMWIKQRGKKGKRKDSSCDYLLLDVRVEISTFAYISLSVFLFLSFPCIKIAQDEICLVIFNNWSK